MARPHRFPAPAPLDPENRRELLLFTNHELPWRYDAVRLKAKADTYCAENGLRQLSASDGHHTAPGGVVVMARTVVAVKIGGRS